MKQRLVKFIRRLFPKSIVHGLEEAYRRSRVYAVSMLYGFPAKNLKIIAVTGTNGKTTTVNLINSILKTAGFKTAMFSTALIEVSGQTKLNDLNATVGLTADMQKFFRLAKRTKVDYVVLEVTSHALAQHKLDGVPFEAAVITNLTQDHLDWHGTMDNYAAAKAKLFKAEPKFIILNRDDQWFEYFNQFAATNQKITYGADQDAECRITAAALHKLSSDFKLLIDHQTKLNLTLNLPGKFNVYNAAAAVATAYLLHIDLDSIKAGLATLTGIPGRQERIELNKPFEVLVDYAHTPDALQQLLENMRPLVKARLILVFGATGDRDKSKRPLMGEVAAKLADRIILTDEEPYSEKPEAIREAVLKGIITAGGEAKTEEIADRRAAIKKALSIAKKGDTVVITGMGHEQFMIKDGKKVPWNDGEVVRELVQ